MKFLSLHFLPFSKNSCQEGTNAEKHHQGKRKGQTIVKLPQRAANQSIPVLLALDKESISQNL